MPNYLVTIDPVAPDEAFLRELARISRKPVADWSRSLVAPLLARPLLDAGTEAEAQDLAARYAELGFGTHVVPTEDLTDALEQAFEAKWAEPSRDGITFIGAHGEELALSSGDIRALTTGRQTVRGKEERFLVAGLRGADGAVILRFPGSEVSKFTHTEDPQDQLEDVLAAISNIAGHARVERGLEAHTGKLPALAFVGATDLAHAAVLSAWLVRQFPPSGPGGQHAAAPSVAARGPSAAAPFTPQAPRGIATRGIPPPRPPVELADDGQERANDASAALAALDAKFAAQADPRAGGVFTKPPTRRRALIAGAGVLLIGVVALVLVLRKPADQQQVVQKGQSWQSAYGATFTYVEPFDASIGGVASPGFVVEVQRSGERATFRVPSHEAKTPRHGLGVSWHVESYDAVGGVAPAWIVIAVRKPGS